MRRKALEERVAPTFKYGKRELLQMVAHINMRLEEKQNKDKWIVEGL